jgi:hypothetical protein
MWAFADAHPIAFTILALPCVLTALVVGAALLAAILVRVD